MISILYRYKSPAVHYIYCFYIVTFFLYVQLILLMFRALFLVNHVQSSLMEIFVPMN